MTFNHGVEGSSPSALTNEINDLDRNSCHSELTDRARRLLRRSRQGHDIIAGSARLGQAGMKPFSLANEIIVKQKVEYSVVNKQGTAAMQFIFDLIWNQSRSKYLVAIAEQEGAL